MGPVPGQPEEIRQEPLGQTVPADDRRRPVAALVGERQRAVAIDFEVALRPEAAHHLGHRRGRDPQPVGETGLDDPGTLLFELEDRFEVLIDRRMHRVGHIFHPTGARVNPLDELS